jgi:hypothetical protein
LWVKQLATRLREDGVDGRLDEWHLPRNGNIVEFMNREVREADWVLVLCSPAYQEKVRATEDGAIVAGVGWESRLLTSRMFVTAHNKVLAALARGDWQYAAPDALLGQLYFDLSRPETFERHYQGLLKAILGTHEKAPPLGPPPQDVAGELVRPLRYAPDSGAATVARGGGGAAADWSKPLLRGATAILFIAIALDVLLAWFVRTALPFSSVTFTELSLSLSPLALILAVALRWVASAIRMRRRLAKE